MWGIGRGVRFVGLGVGLGGWPFGEGGLGLLRVGGLGVVGVGKGRGLGFGALWVVGLGGIAGWDVVSDDGDVGL